MSARLTIEMGEGSPMVHDLAPDRPVTLGRHRNNTIVLRDEHASRWHAEIVHEAGRWLLRDIGAPLNGTRLNGERIRQATALEDGQEITIGDTRLRIELSPDQTPPTAPQIELAPDGIPDSGPDLLTTHLQPDELTALCSFMSKAVEEEDARSLIRRALQLILQQTTASVVGFLSLDPDNPLSKIVLPELAQVDFHLSRQLTQKVQRGRVVWLGGEVNETPPNDSLMPFTDALCIPLKGESVPLGAIHVYKSNMLFTERHLRFSEALAGYLASSLRVLRARRILEAENTRLRTKAPVSDQIIGTSTAMNEVRQLISRAAPRPATVLIHGESGVGKELVALALHRQSHRRDGPLVVLNCAAIAPNLLEAELFGYCKGAFTGADRNHPGLFQQADEGTLFLDEIGEMPLDCQAKLLRVIEGRGFRPVGATAEIKTDVRIIAATNRDLEVEVKEKRFRNDLFFRLQVVQITVPPLREHKDDIPALVDHFLALLSGDGRRNFTLTEAGKQKLKDYSWPGNVRQLRAVLESAIALSEGDTLDINDLRLPSDTTIAPTDMPPSLKLEDVEAWAIRLVLRQTSGNITQAAKTLGVVRDTLAAKMKKYGISKDEV